MLFLHTQPIVTVARLGKFERGTVLAKSLKFQRNLLKAARHALREGKVALAKKFLKVWTRERKAFKIALSWQSI